MTTRAPFPALPLSAAGILAAVAGAVAQVEPATRPPGPARPAAEIPSRSVPYPLDSGRVLNDQPAPRAVFSKTVFVPHAPWLRLTFSGVELGGIPGWPDASYLRLTSLADGAVQTLNAANVREWANTSAYFNGDAVVVELIASPGIGPNRVAIDQVLVGRNPDGLESICGPTDTRVLSNNPRDGRLLTYADGVCSAWIINDARGCLLSAGHCHPDAGTIVEFGVPTSSDTGAITHPGPQFQFAVDPVSVQTSPGNPPPIGADWTYFGCHPNPVTGTRPGDARGSYTLANQAPPAANQLLRETGYGSVSAPVSLTWNLVEKTATGPYTALAGTEIRFRIDDTPGNSGASVILEGGEAIGIATHGGCDNPLFNYNSGTAIQNADLQAALAAPQGCCAPPGNAVFMGLGILPGGTTLLSHAYGMSPDGNVVVGYSSSGNASPGGYEAFRWIWGVGMSGLGDLPGGAFNSVAYAASLGGRVIVGYGATDTASYEAFRYDANGMTSLGNLGSPPNFATNSAAFGVSSNGTTIVGQTSYYDPGPPVTSGFCAFEWNPDSGPMHRISDVSAYGTRVPYAISAYGQTIVGIYGSHATRTTNNVGDWQDLGDLPGGADSSIARAVDAIGITVVGGSSSTNSGFYGNEAFRWTPTDGMQGLGSLQGPGYGSFAYGISGDGRYIVGVTDTQPFGGGSPRAFIWNSVNGMLDLKQMLIDQFGLGPVLANWNLTEAVGISTDGSTITGNGFGPNGEEAWIVRLYVPPPVLSCGGSGCYANCDASTTPPVLTVADFACFLNAFAAGVACANCTGSTTPPVLNVTQFACFLNKFAAGCS